MVKTKETVKENNPLKPLKSKKTHTTNKTKKYIPNKVTVDKRANITTPPP